MRKSNHKWQRFRHGWPISAEVPVIAHGGLAFFVPIFISLLYVAASSRTNELSTTNGAKTECLGSLHEKHIKRGIQWYNKYERHPGKAAIDEGTAA